MSITKRNYVPGTYEPVADISLGDAVVNQWTYFVLDGYFKFELADIVITVDSPSGQVLVSGTDYSLAKDKFYTSLESDYSGETLYGMFKMINGSLSGRALYVSGKNFGTMIDNEKMKKYIDDHQGAITDLSIGEHTADDIEIVPTSGTSVVIPSATETLAGLMSAADKVALEHVASISDGNGVVTGMTISVGSPASTFSISAGTYHNIGNGIITYDGVTNQPVTNIGSQIQTYIAVNTSTGNVVQQASPFTPSQRRLYVVLGTLIHTNLSTINAVNNQPDVAVNSLSQLNDLMDGIGVFNIDGNVFSPCDTVGDEMSIAKSSGSVYKRGINFSVDPTDPHTKDFASQTKQQIRLRLSNGVESTNQYHVSPDYESSTGVISAIPPNKFSTYRIVLFPSGLVRLQYGQSIYNTMAEAISGIVSESYVVEQNMKDNGLLRGYLVIRGNTVDLDDASFAKFLEADRFGRTALTGGSGAGGSYPYDDVKDPTGFVAPASVVVTYNKASRTVTLTGNTKSLWRGVEILDLVSGWESAPHDVAIGQNYFLYYNGTDFVWSTTLWTFDLFMIAEVYAKTADTFGVREPHGVMGYQTHANLHKSTGTILDSGATWSGYTLNSTTATNRRPVLSSSVILDEDVPTTNPSVSTGEYCRFFLSATGTPNFSVDNVEILSVGANGRFNYNLNTAGTWSTAESATNAYGKLFVVNIPVTSDSDSQKYRTLFLMAQTTSLTLATIKAIVPSIYDWGALAGAGVSEFVFVGEIIVRSTASSWQLIEVNRLTGTRVSQLSSPSNTIPLSDSTPLANGTASAGTGLASSREDHVHPTDTSRAPAVHTSITGDYGKATDGVYGHVIPSHTVPEKPVGENGTGSVGTDNSVYARGDHAHPACIKYHYAAGSILNTSTITVPAEWIDSMIDMRELTQQAVTFDFTNTGLGVGDVIDITLYTPTIVTTTGVGQDRVATCNGFTRFTKLSGNMGVIPSSSSGGGSNPILPDGMAKATTSAEFKTAMESASIHTIVCTAGLTLSNQTYTVAGDSAKGKLIYGEPISIVGTTTFNGNAMSVMFKTDVTGASATITGVANMKVKFRKLFLTANITASTVICHYELLVAGAYTTTGLSQNYWDSSNVTGNQASFTLNFKFTRIGFPSGNYSGGHCDLPYTEFTEDSATLNHTGKGVRGTVACRVTAVTVQFDLMAGNVTAYIKKNGVETDLGTVTSVSKWATFTPVGYTISAGDEVLVGFYSASNGSFTYPTATVFIREA